MHGVWYIFIRVVLKAVTFRPTTCVHYMSTNTSTPGTAKKGSLFENPTALFIAIIVLAMTFVGLMSLPQSEALLRPVDQFTATSFAAIMSLFGMDCKSQGILLTLQLGGTYKSILVGYGCDGVQAYLILISAILPFPCSLRQKFLGLLNGLIFVFVINQIRLLGLILILYVIKDAEDFAFYHTGVGQVYALVLIFIYWSYWASKVVKAKQAAHAAASTQPSDTPAEPA